MFYSWVRSASKTSLCTLLTVWAVCVYSYGQEQATKQWELVNDRNGIQIYTLDREDDETKVVKGSTHIEAPISRIIDFINDANVFKMWMPNMVTSYQLEQTEKNEQYVYCEAWMPWPFSNRDLVSRMTTHWYSADSACIKVTAFPIYIEPKEHIVRMEDANGQWVLSSLEKGKTLVQYEFYGNPGDMLPRWVRNIYIHHISYKSLENLRFLIESDNLDEPDCTLPAG